MHFDAQLRVRIWTKAIYCYKLRVHKLVDSDRVLQALWGTQAALLRGDFFLFRTFS